MVKKDYGPISRKLIKFGLSPEKALSLGALKCREGNETALRATKSFLGTLGHVLDRNKSTQALSLCGKPGTGKTALIVAIMIEALRLKINLYYINCRNVNKLWPAFDMSSEIKELAANEVTTASRAELLVIDDLGYEMYAPRLCREGFEIWLHSQIDAIYQSNRRLILSSEKSPGIIKKEKWYGARTESLVSRIGEMTGHKSHILKNKSWR